MLRESWSLFQNAQGDQISIIMQSIKFHHQAMQSPAMHIRNCQRRCMFLRQLLLCSIKPVKMRAHPHFLPWPSQQSLLGVEVQNLTKGLRRKFERVCIFRELDISQPKVQGNALLAIDCKDVWKAALLQCHARKYARIQGSVLTLKRLALVSASKRVMCRVSMDWSKLSCRCCLCNSNCPVSVLYKQE